MKKCDLINLCYSAVIDGGNTGEQMTRETAINTICNWIIDGVITEYIEPDYFASVYNSVLNKVKRGNNND